MDALTRDIQVLHIDDSQAFLDLAAEFLEHEAPDFTIHSESDPETALARIDETEPDCVVSDYDMADMDGIALCRQFRETNPDLPFILFTSKTGEDVLEDALAAGVTDYTQKAAGRSQYTLLANRIRLLVSRHRALSDSGTQD